MSYVQFVLRRLELEKMPRGERPVFSTELGDHERIVGVEHYFVIDLSSRKTVDHIADVWVEVRL